MKNTNSILLVAIVLLIGLFVASMTVPINDNKDAFITADISFDALSTHPKVTNIKAYSIPHTLLKAPDVMGALIYSGNLKLEASTPTTFATANIGTLTKLVDSSVSSTVVLRDIPVTEKTITVRLTEDNNVLSTYEVTLQ